MVGARAPGTEQIVFLLFLGFFLKDALWGGGGTHRSWPGGRGGRPRALVAGEGWGGRRGDDSSKEGGVGAWLAVPKEEQVQGRGQGRVGLAVGGGARASVAGG